MLCFSEVEASSRSDRLIYCDGFLPEVMAKPMVDGHGVFWVIGVVLLTQASVILYRMIEFFMH